MIGGKFYFSFFLKDLSICCQSYRGRASSISHLPPPPQAAAVARAEQAAGRSPDTRAIPAALPAASRELGQEPGPMEDGGFTGNSLLCRNAGLGRHQEPGTPSGQPRWVAGAWVLGPPAAAFSVLCRELGCNWSSRDLNQCSNMECWCHKQLLNPLCLTHDADSPSSGLR